MEEIIGSVATPVGRRLNMKVEKGKIIIDHDYGHIEINVGCFCKVVEDQEDEVLQSMGGVQG